MIGDNCAASWLAVEELEYVPSQEEQEQLSRSLWAVGVLRLVKVIHCLVTLGTITHAPLQCSGMLKTLHPQLLYRNQK